MFQNGQFSSTLAYYFSFRCKFATHQTAAWTPPPECVETLLVLYCNGWWKLLSDIQIWKVIFKCFRDTNVCFWETGAILLHLRSKKFVFIITMHWVLNSSQEQMRACHGRRMTRDTDTCNTAWGIWKIPGHCVLTGRTEFNHMIFFRVS